MIFRVILYKTLFMKILFIYFLENIKELKNKLKAAKVDTKNIEFLSAQDSGNFVNTIRFTRPRIIFINGRLSAFPERLKNTLKDIGDTISIYDIECNNIYTYGMNPEKNIPGIISHISALGYITELRKSLLKIS